MSSFHGIRTSRFRLYVGDDCTSGSGVISSWKIEYTHIPCYPVCLVKKADAATVNAGSPIGFTLEVSNELPGQDSYSVGLDDPLPSGTGINWTISPPYSGPGSCSITGAIGSQNLSCGFGLDPGDVARVHVSSATSMQSCGGYTNTATLTAFGPVPGGLRREDSASITVTGCPTAVRIDTLSATRSARGVLVRWRTASDIGLLGFNLFRDRAGRLLRVNPTPTLIPSVSGGSASGHAYSWLDRAAPRRGGTLKYRLQTVHLDGARRWVGTALAGR